MSSVSAGIHSNHVGDASDSTSQLVNLGFIRLGCGFYLVETKITLTLCGQD